MRDRPQERVGALGLGNMGLSMWLNLVDQGIAAAAFDINESALREPREREVFVASSPKELGTKCRIVLICVPTSAQVVEALFGSDGLVEGLEPGALVVDATSGWPESSRQIAARLKEAGHDYIDAGVNGGSNGARAGTLRIMVGATDEAFARAEFLLDAMGHITFRCGPVGSGHAMKVVLNMSNISKNLVELEALTVGARFGLDPAQVGEVVNSRIWATHVLGRQVPTRQEFSMAMCVKDLKQGVELGADNDCATPIISAALQMARISQLESDSDADVVDFAKVYQRWNGVQLAAADW
jgi:3-hydroxyisobutyrate dehydrogenase